MAFVLLKTAGYTAGTDSEVSEGAEAGGGATWGERPWIFLPLPLLLLFLAVLLAEDMAQEMALSLPGLVAALEEVGLTKGPLFLRIDC